MGYTKKLISGSTNYFDSLLGNEAKYMYFDENGVSVSPEFHVSSDVFDDKVVLGTKSTPDSYEGFGLYDLRHKRFILEPIYDDIGYDSESGIVIRKWHEEGEYSPVFDETVEESFVMACDAEGNDITEQAYHSIKVIGSRYLLVEHDKHYGNYYLLDREGDFVIDGLFENIWVSLKFFICKCGNELVIYKKDGEQVAIYECDQEPYKTLSKYDRSMGYECSVYKDLSGPTPSYYRISEFFPRYFAVKEGDYWGLLKVFPIYKIVLPFEYDKMQVRFGRVEASKNGISYSFNLLDGSFQSHANNQRFLNHDSNTNNEACYVFFDTETTGLPKDYRASVYDTNNWPRIVQISWLVVSSDRTILKQEDHIIRPSGFIIPEESTAVHGISQEKALKEGESLSSVMTKFVSDLDGANYVVGHNVDFDIKIVQCECVRLKLDNPFREKQIICTMKASTDYCKIPGPYGYKWPKLQELYTKLFGRPFQDAHNSLSDIKATYDCYWKLRELRML